MSASTRSAEIIEGFERLHAEGRIVELLVILRSDLPALFGRRLAGDADASALIAMADQSIEVIQSAPATEPILCGSCQMPLGNRDFAMVFVRTALGEPHRSGMGLVICTGCAATRAAVRAKAMSSLRDVWPDLREITVGSIAGHA